MGGHLREIRLDLILDRNGDYLFGSSRASGFSDNPDAFTGRTVSGKMAIDATINMVLRSRGGRGVAGNVAYGYYLAPSGSEYFSSPPVVSISIK